MERKSISVCMATYNGEKYVEEQIKSVLTQLDNSDEIIVSDDNSTDNTIEIIKSFNDQRIKIFINKNKGIVNNFQNAIKQAQGDYLFLADQDDVWLPNKVSNSLNSLKTNDLVVSNCIVTDENLKTIHPSYFKLNNSKKGFFKNFYRSSYLGSCLAFRKEILVDILPFPNNLYLYHDWWIGFIADKKYKVEFIETVGMLYRRHDYNMSTTGAKSKQSLYKRFRDRLQLLYLANLRLLKKSY